MKISLSFGRVMSSIVLSVFSVFLLTLTFGVVFAQTTYSTVTNLAPAEGAVVIEGDLITWSPITNATGYALWVGTVAPSSSTTGSNCVTTKVCEVYKNTGSTNPSFTLNTVPDTGQTLYARLWWQVGTTWYKRDVTYKASMDKPAITPIPNSTLSGSTVTFTWEPIAGAVDYAVYLGTGGEGSHDIYPVNLTADNGSTGSATIRSKTIGGIPTAGQTLYLRLYYRQSGTTNWPFKDYQYKAKTI